MRRPPQPRVLRSSPSLFRTSIDHDIIGRRRPEGGVVPSLPDEDGRTTAPLERESQASARFQKASGFPAGTRTELGSRCESSAGNLRSSGKRANFFRLWPTENIFGGRGSGQRLLRLLRVRAQRFFGNQRRFSVMLAFEDPHFAEAGISFDGQQTQLISRFEQQQSFFRDHH